MTGRAGGEAGEGKDEEDEEVAMTRYRSLRVGPRRRRASRQRIRVTRRYAHSCANVAHSLEIVNESQHSPVLAIDRRSEQPLKFEGIRSLRFNCVSDSSVFDSWWTWT